MDPIVGLIVGIGIALIGAGASRWPRDPSLVARRGFAKLPRKPLRATREGDWVHVSGVATSGATLISPVTRRPCIGYRYCVESTEEGAMVLARGDDCASFTLSTEGISALVEGPFTFGLDLMPIGPLAQSELRTLLPWMGEEFWENKGELKMRVLAASLSTGDQVAVLGQVSLEVHPQGERESFRDPPMRRILRGKAARRVLLANDGAPS